MCVCVHIHVNGLATLYKMFRHPPYGHVHVENVASWSLLHCLTKYLWIASPELPKFAEMLLENNAAFITP